MTVRYTVAVIAGAGSQPNLTLLVPFEPSALVSAFIDEIYKRARKQGVQLDRDTHIATLHLCSQDGALIDHEDVLEDAVEPDEKLFAVFKPHAANSAARDEASGSTDSPIHDEGHNHFLVRVVSPELAKQDRASIVPIKIERSSTVKDLHNTVAEHLGLPHIFEKPGLDNECNCALAKKLADGAAPPNGFYVVHGKSVVKRFGLPTAGTETAIKEILQASLEDVNNKKTTFHGAEMHAAATDGGESSSTYKKPPVVAICSNQRHVPHHAKASFDDGPHIQRVLDLHTTEVPISRACMDLKLEKLGLDALLIDGVLEIFAVHRATSSGSSAIATGAGKSSIFRYRAHWEPIVKQSDRGLALFLSSLRVFASIVQDQGDELRSKDSLYHIFDLLTRFPPALRTMHLLVEGMTPTAVEAAALSHALFEVLHGFMPTEIIGDDRSRLFEGSRLLFGFFLERSRAVKLPEDVVNDESLPYLSSFSSLDLRDANTTEPVMHAVHTSAGLVEEALFDAFNDRSLLADSHLQSFMVKVDELPLTCRVALLSGGAIPDVMVFSARRLTENYCYPDAGRANAVFDIAELAELHQLAEFCGRNKLTVHKPRELVSAVAPCLAFDRNAHVAVYTGQLPCATPGESSSIFRPLHGSETVEESVLEQLIAPIIQGYESDGTAVLDALGGAAVRRLQAPDEIIMFAVDVSASMKQATDFAEVNEDPSPVVQEPSAQSLVPLTYYNNTNLDEMKEFLTGHESFADMVATVADVGDSRRRRRRVASELIDLVRIMLSTSIVEQNKKIQDLRSGPRLAFGSSHHHTVARLQAKLDSTMKSYAGLSTLGEDLCDFLIFSATTARHISSEQWSWSLGDEIPNGSPPRHLPSLPAAVTDIPDGLVCPISHSLMEDAVTATDSVTYSRSAIEQWFAIRHRSPMHNVELQDISLRPNTSVSTAVAEFILGHGLINRGHGLLTRARSDTITLTFVSRTGRFERTVPRNTSITDLYKLVFRGLKARYMVFELVLDDIAIRPSEKTISSISSKGSRHGCQITVRLADDANMVVSSGGTAAASVRSEMVLVKVYSHEEMLCSYWVNRDTPVTLGTVLWKYWRAVFVRNSKKTVGARTVWTDLSHSGDGMLTGNMRDIERSLATFLNREHCFGKLGHEPVHREENSEENSEVGEQPLVLKLLVSGAVKKSSHGHNTVLSRLDVLKQLFEALINRLIAYSYKTHVGLITFSSTARVAAPPTHVLENLRKAVAKMTPAGDTCLWDAVAVAMDQLQTYAARYPDAKKRIIVISDGSDTASTGSSSQELAWRMQQLDIALDSVCLGQEDQRELQTISWMRGCYRFHPKSLVAALTLTEMEPFLSVTERPTITPPQGTPRTRLLFMGRFWDQHYHVEPTLVDEDNVPPRKEHPNIHDGVIALSSAARRPSTRPAPSSNARSNMRVTRIMQEINRFVATGGHPRADIYVSESDISFFKIVLQGPDESPYSQGTFMLYLHFSDTYPTWAPEARFVTPIKHPNVNAHGRICHALFGRDWTSDVSLSTIVDTIFGLLLQAETSDPVNTSATLSYHHDGVEYADEVREFVVKHALRTRAEWKAELVGEDEGVGSGA